MSSYSKMVDADIVKAKMDYNVQNTITQYKLFTQVQMQNQAIQNINLML